MSSARPAILLGYDARMKTILLLAISLTACITEEERLTGSCMGNGPQPACIEYTNASSDELELDAEPMCATGTWHLAACTRLTAIGGCTANVTGPYGSFTLTSWFYPGGPIVTEGDVIAKCNALGQHFVSP